MSKGNLALALAAVFAAACADPGPQTPTPSTGDSSDALSAAQCMYFASNGKVRICHATGSKKNPYTVINVSDQGCVDGHARHAGDYVAANDTNCSGGGFLPPGAPCDATLACSAGYECRNATCQATDLCRGVTCASAGACDYAYCDPANGACVHEPTSGNDCSDGNACTEDDTCNAGACGGTTLAVDDGNACTADSCNPATGAVHTAVSADDGNACTADSCDPATGVAHAAVDIDDGDLCTTDSCDPATGVAHTAVDADDNNACTTDTCDPASGVAHTAVATDDNNACTDDSCDPASGVAHTAVAIDDNNACTTDSCDSSTGVAHAAVATDDGNACTDDSCSPSTGVSHTPVATDDGDDCTADSCDPTTGVSHTPIDSPACTPATDPCVAAGGKSLDGTCYVYRPPTCTAGGNAGCTTADEAEAACANTYAGGHLASINSAAENDFVSGVIDPNNQGFITAWVGARSASTGGFNAGGTWTDGSAWGYTNWRTQTGEPSEGTVANNCVQFWPENTANRSKFGVCPGGDCTGWNDGACGANVDFGYVCQFIPSSPVPGCSDGTREGFADVATYPGIAACSGGWSIPGVRTSSTVNPACGRVSGNTSSNPSGAGCNVADLCSAGFHVCNNATEVASKTAGNGCNDAKVNDAFFIQREASYGYYSCVETGDLSTAQNDIWGCGGTSPLMSGIFTTRPCGVLNATTHDGGGSMAAPWNLNVGGLSSYVEAATVTKSGSEHGGVLCCAD